MISSIRGYNSYSYYNQYNSYRNYNNYGFSSSLFGSNALTGTSSSFSVSYYSMIRSGAYKKLMKAYYSQDKSSNVKSLVKDKEPASVLTAQDAASMGNSIKDVMKASLWEKKSITEKDESGNETVKLDYDREAIGKALQKFTEDYNKTVDAAVRRTFILGNVEFPGSVAVGNVQGDPAGNAGVEVGRDLQF